jgi:hypothetical protein
MIFVWNSNYFTAQNWQSWSLNQLPVSVLLGYKSSANFLLFFEKKIEQGKFLQNIYKYQFFIEQSQEIKQTSFHKESRMNEKQIKSGRNLKISQAALSM